MELDKIDMNRLYQAWNRVVERHISSQLMNRNTEGVLQAHTDVEQWRERF